MSLRAYSEINLHFTWHVKDDNPVLRNEIETRNVLAWQTGYGVVSFGSNDLPWVTAYVRNQRKDHASGTTHERLEQIDPPEGKPAEAG